MKTLNIGYQRWPSSLRFIKATPIWDYMKISLWSTGIRLRFDMRKMLCHIILNNIMFYRIQFDTVSDDMVVYNIVSYETI